MSEKIYNFKRTIQKHTGLKPNQQNDDVVEVMHDPVLNYNGLLGMSKTYEMMQDSAPTFYDFLLNNADIIKSTNGLSVFVPNQTEASERSNQQADEIEEEPFDEDALMNPKYPRPALMDAPHNLKNDRPTPEQKQLEEYINHKEMRIHNDTVKYFHQTSKSFLITGYWYTQDKLQNIKENFIKYLCLSPEPTKQQLQIATKIYGMLDYDTQGKQGEPIFEAILQLVELRKQQEAKPKPKPGQQELTEEKLAQLREFENDYIYDNSEPPKEPESDDSSTDTLAKWD